jgi:hypothetical protein
MTFSLDIHKPLSRVGFVVNLIFLTVVFSGLSWLSYGLMTNTVPNSSIHKKMEQIAQKAQDQVFAKAKAAAKGKVFDEKAALEAAKAEGLAAAEKEYEKVHHEASALWGPFSIFLLIICAIFFSGFLSVALQRRANAADLKGLLVFLGHVGGWAYATFIAFEPYLTHQQVAKSWLVAPIVGFVLMLPAFLKSESHEAHSHH